MTKDNDQLEREIGELRAQVAALPGVSQRAPMFSTCKDVHIGAVTPLADGDSFFWKATEHAIVNGPPSAGGGYPVGPYDDGTDTYEITAASLVQKLSTVVNGTGENAYVAAAANTSVQQAAIVADNNAGTTGQITVIVVAGSSTALLSADKINVGTLPTSAGAPGDLYQTAGVVMVSP